MQRGACLGTGCGGNQGNDEQQERNSCLSSKSLHVESLFLEVLGRFRIDAEPCGTAQLCEGEKRKASNFKGQEGPTPPLYLPPDEGKLDEAVAEGLSVKPSPNTGRRSA